MECAAGAQMTSEVAPGGTIVVSWPRRPAARFGPVQESRCLGGQRPERNARWTTGPTVPKLVNWPLDVPTQSLGWRARPPTRTRCPDSAQRDRLPMLKLKPAYAQTTADLGACRGTRRERPSTPAGGAGTHNSAGPASRAGQDSGDAWPECRDPVAIVRRWAPSRPPAQTLPATTAATAAAARSGTYQRGKRRRGPSERGPSRRGPAARSRAR